MKMFRIFFPDQIEDTTLSPSARLHSIEKATVLHFKIIFGFVLFVAALGLLFTFGLDHRELNPVMIAVVCGGGLVALTFGTLFYLSRKSS